MNNLSYKDLILPTDLVLEFSEETKATAWRQSQLFSASESRWHAFINQLSLDVFLADLKEEFPQATGWQNNRQNWEIVNGSAINLDHKRSIVIPSDAIETEVVEIPQEWVDLPSWRGDYYLALQVDTAENFLRVWGYTTHKTLKEKGEYDRDDRSYRLDGTHLIEDLNVLWLAREFCPDEVTQSAIPSLPVLAPNQANLLITQLKTMSRSYWRTALPFAQWGALLENTQDREKLWDDRLQWPILQWLATGIEETAQQIGWSLRQLEPSLAATRGEEPPTISNIVSRRVTIAGQPYELQIQPQNEPGIWRFSLQNLTIGGLVPGGFKLRLLTDTQESFPENERMASTAMETLSITVQLDPGDGLIWEIEPSPDNYQPEILRF